MLDAARLAGVIGAHAVWTLSELPEGASFTPLLSKESTEGAVSLGELTNEAGPEHAVAYGKQVLQSIPEDVVRMVLAWDDHMSVGEQDMPCVVLEARDAAHPEALLRLAVPYERQEGLRLQPVRVLAMEQCGDVQAQQLLEAFFSGVARHQQGAAAWKKATADRA